MREVTRPFEEPTGPLPAHWAPIEVVNAARAHYGLAPIPSSLELTQTLLEYGFTDCLGVMYMRPIGSSYVATSEAEVSVS